MCLPHWTTNPWGERAMSYSFLRNPVLSRVLGHSRCLPVFRTLYLKTEEVIWGVVWSLYRLRVLVASDRVLASGDLLNPSAGFGGRTAGCVSLFSLLRFWFTFLPWLCPSGSQWQSPGKSALRPPQPAGLVLQVWHPDPADCQGCCSSLCSHHLFWKSTDAPGVLLPCLGILLRLVILHFLVSSLNPSHRHLLIFHPDFLVVLSAPSSDHWKWQIPSLLLFSFTPTFLPYYAYFQVLT